jgi:hypothetical protein
LKLSKLLTRDEARRIAANIAKAAGAVAARRVKHGAANWQSGRFPPT